MQARKSTNTLASEKQHLIWICVKLSVVRWDFFHAKLFDETQVSHDKQQQEVLMPQAISTVTADYFYLKSPEAEQSACRSPSLRHTEPE